MAKIFIEEIFSQQKENIKIKIHLLEFSKVLKSYQKEKLKQYCHELKWYNNIFKITSVCSEACISKSVDPLELYS